MNPKMALQFECVGAGGGAVREGVCTALDARLRDGERIKYNIKQSQISVHGNKLENRIADLIIHT